MSADKEKYIHLAAIESVKKWNELWLVMSENDITRYNSLKSIDVFEFWVFYDSWKEKMEGLKTEHDKLKRKK